MYHVTVECAVQILGTEAAVLIYRVQGPLCVNENNGYNGSGEFFIGNC